MTKGIRVIWRDDNGKTDEIEYFCGIDVDQLDHIPAFATVPAVWPRHLGGTSVVYSVNTHCAPGQTGELRLTVTYDAAQLQQLGAQWGFDIYGGQNVIILEQGRRQGRCEWWRDGAAKFEEVVWKAFDLSAGRPRPPRPTSRTWREAGFRALILARDDHRCVLTREATVKALDAAHLIPAANGENDVPCNGITLRADLHRLFDARLFTFDPDGRVVRIARELSADYRRLLRNRRLPTSTLERVRATLALPEFQNWRNAE